MIFESWLRTRPANLIVSGDKSETIDLANMVFQGTVWGCIFWNVFFHDSKHAVRKSGCKEIVYADDLNAYKEYDRSVQNEDIIIDLEICQKDVHLWGAANQVVFDSGKEGMFVLSHENPSPGTFHVLGVEFDCKLSMNRAIGEISQAMRWKLIMITRSRKYHSDSDLVTLYKAHVLSYIEYRTAAI